jgi:hypothetical protein
MNKTYTCSCEFHQIYFESVILNNKDKMLNIAIYQHRSENTGKEFIKPKLLADVVLYESDIRDLAKILGGIQNEK